MKSEKFATFKRSAWHAALASAIALGGMSLVGGAYAIDATATASGTVVAPITNTKVADLQFGKFAPGASAGTITVSTSGVQTAGGGVVRLTGTSTTAARFDITGEASATYSITHGGTSVLTHATIPANTMALTKYSDLTASNSTSGNVSAGTLSVSGAESIYVGGQLAVAANQAAGVYSGTVVITVEYN